MLIDDRAGCVEKCDVFSQHDWRHAGSLKRCCHCRTRTVGFDPKNKIGTCWYMLVQCHLEVS